MLGTTIGRLSFALLQGPPTVGSEATNQAIARTIRHGPPGGGWTVLVPILVPLGVFAFAGFVVWLKVRQQQAETTAMAELHKSLIARFTSGTELAAFLSSEGGQRLLDSMALHGSGIKQRVIRNIMVGVILSALGLGFLGLSGLRDHGFLIPAVILLALGAGFLISAAITYRLSKSMGLLRDGQAGPLGSLPSAM